MGRCGTVTRNPIPEDVRRRWWHRTDFGTHCREKDIARFLGGSGASVSQGESSAMKS